MGRGLERPRTLNEQKTRLLAPSLASAFHSRAIWLPAAAKNGVALDFETVRKIPV